MLLKTEKTLKVHVIWERTQEFIILICEEASTRIKNSSDFQRSCEIISKYNSSSGFFFFAFRN